MESGLIGTPKAISVLFMIKKKVSVQSAITEIFLLYLKIEINWFLSETFINSMNN